MAGPVMSDTDEESAAWVTRNLPTFDADMVAAPAPEDVTQHAGEPQEGGSHLNARAEQTQSNLKEQP